MHPAVEPSLSNHRMKAATALSAYCKPSKIGLLDAMGHGNLGDAAIQDSVIANIRRRLPDVQIIGFSFVPEDTQKRHSIPCHPIARKLWLEWSESEAKNSKTTQARLKSVLRRRPRMWRLMSPMVELVREVKFLAGAYHVLKDLDILVFSGGGQLGDLWGGPWGHPYNLIKFALLAKLAGREVYFLNVGAEALDHWLSRFFIKSALRLASYVAFRDEASRDQMQKLGLEANHSVNPDPAYALEMAGYKNETAHRGASLVVGINPIGYCDPRIWPKKDQTAYDDYLKKLTVFSRWLLDRGYQLKLFPTSPSVDKYAIADLEKQLADQSAPDQPNTLPTARRNDAVQSVHCETVADILSEMSACDYILTSKYHGVIFSQLLQKPVIAIGYHRKVNTAMQAAGQEQLSQGIENFQAGWLVESFQSAVRNREELRLQQANAVAKFAKLLHNQFDALFAQPG
jgi:polysaccharide pyruvyl transferase WcaK-like protein